MKKDQVVILEKRGTLLITGDDAKDFLQNIITNDINKVTPKNSIFSALLTPQGKYLNENTGECTDCPEGYYKDKVSNDVSCPDRCSENSKSAKGAKSKRSKPN